MDRPSELDERAEAALRVLRAAERPLLVGHERPDSDVLGSEAALADGLAMLGALPTIVNPDAPARGFEFVEPACGFGFDRGGRLPRHDLVVFLDLNELSRTGAMAERLAASTAPKLVVDHHVLPDVAWWDEAIVDVGAAATGVLVARVLHRLGVPIEGNVARGVLVALVGDTGSFRFDNTNEEALSIAAECARGGASTSQIHAAMAQRRDPRFPAALAAHLARARYLEDGRVAIVDEPRSLGTGGLPGLSDVVLDVLRSVEEVEIALHVRELEDGSCKLSARAKAPADVHDLAIRLGGGGHVRAAGATVDGPLDAAVARVLDALEASLAARAAR
ncbi:MAG: DHH family phosphoesterase [Planctomycetota bacterium]